ncbi:MAG: precorrin-3B C(17)-methyltransferase [Victivallales bacterium]|nr:precorrin-3B C(17)-methyltransferase [Victivallales bacterium]
MKTYIAGVGCRRGVKAEDIRDAMDAVLDGREVSCIATCAIKSDEYGLLEYAESTDTRLVFFTPEELSGIEVPSPSEKVRSQLGLDSVCEAAALAAGGRIVVPKVVVNSKVTVSLAEKEIPAGLLSVVGIGSGAEGMLTPQARSAIAGSDVVAGYKSYISLLPPSLVGGKKIISTGMTQEVERCRLALVEAAAGKKVAFVCSGDAGVYGMSGLLLELVEKQGEMSGFELSFVPGMTAAIVAGSALGAPLMNDFAVLSLSDLLTPRGEIVKKIDMLAGADMVCVVYNPRSKKRKELLGYMVKAFAEARGAGTFFGAVKNAGRTDEMSVCGTLEHFPEKFIDMNSIVIIGNSHTVLRNGRLYTRRGYQL